MRIRSFQAKLLFLVIAGLVALQAATLVAVHVAGRSTLNDIVAEELRVGSRVLAQVLHARGRRLADSVQVLAADFGFREAIASGDGPTIASVLANHGSRLDADVVFLLNLDGTVAADTVGGRFGEIASPFRGLVAEALADGDATTIVTFDDRPYQQVMVPVRAPQPIALVCMGFAIDETVLDEVARLTALDVSMWSAARGKRSFLISTLSSPLQGALLEYAQQLQPISSPVQQSLTLGPDSYETLRQPLETRGGAPVNVLLQRSIEQARLPVRRLELQIFLLSSLALLATVVGASVLARGVSRPLHKLAEGARQIGRGDYGTALDVDRKDEIGMLASALDAMRTGIGEREEQIRFQATHDGLTGLPNRSLFLDRLAHAIEAAKRHGSLVGMLIMDLDRFKEINDTIGHQFGDDLLIEVGRRLRSVTRDADTVARLGGDEFAVMFETENGSHAVDIARRTLRALDAPFALGAVSIDVKASMGIALYPVHASDPGTLMKCTDVAMYDAKRGHQSFAVYESVKDEHSLRRLTLLSELRHAIDSDQLELHYQPKIEVSSRRAVHAEALVRWRHPVHGMMPPDEFVPLAEQSGSIGALTKWVLRRAIDDCALWRRSGHDLGVAVNLSAVDLYDPELPTLINGLLHDQQLAPSELVLEITESTVMKDAAHAAQTLRDLKKRGIGLAIDDFGTGYSSLAHLKRLPVDELKIDKSFVMNLRDSPSEDAVIVHSTVELGHNMGLKVIAEGVENAEAWELLERFGCDMAQGYFVARPLPLAELTSWLKESRWRPGTTD